jgi:hypothetical protein
VWHFYTRISGKEKLIDLSEISSISCMTSFTSFVKVKNNQCTSICHHEKRCRQLLFQQQNCLGEEQFKWKSVKLYYINGQSSEAPLLNCKSQAMLISIKID